jgi:GNAT superfamily N-acetyltransferase
MGLDDDTDTLGRWMCHHVSALIDRASGETTEAGRLAAQHEAVSTILALWEKRASLPGNAYPLARYKYLLQCLATTSPDASIWESNRQSPLIEASGQAFREVASIVNIALSLHSKPPIFKSRRKPTPEVTIVFLKAFEQKILGAVEDLDDSSLELLASNGSKILTTDPESKALQSLLKCIEGTHNALEKLAEQTKIKLASKSDVASQTATAQTDEWKVSVVKKLSDAAIQECGEVLKEGAAVNVAAAMRGLPDAKKIVVAKQGKQIIGVAVIKPFRSAYAGKIAKESSARIESGTAELGYVAVRSSYRKKGLGSKLIEALLADGTDPLFATTLSVAMKKLLSAQGFRKTGNSWSGQHGQLTLWKRPAVASA